MNKVINIFESIKSTSSLNDKKAIISENKDNELFKKCLVFLLDSNIQTGLSEKKITKKLGFLQSINVTANCESMMNYLKENNSGRDSDISIVQSFISNQPEEYQEFYREFFTKKYRLGCDAKVVNSVIPNLIPTFNVMLGTPIEKVSLDPNKTLFLSRKLNGTRASFVGDKLMTRQGKQYIGVDHIIKDLQTLVGTDMFVDGELLYKNKEGLSDSEAFQVGTGLANSKAEDKSELKLVVFDMFPLEEFWNGASKETYSARRNNLIELKSKIELLDTENIEIVEMFYHGNDHSEIWKWLDYCEENDYEGCMINLDAPYECKRTKNLIKVKKFFEKDLRCTSVNIATSGKYKGVLGSITCNYFGDTVDVGSGFNDKQRKYYAEHPEEIVGKIISVKYKEETKNKDGGKSLQFPVFMGILIDRDLAADEI